MKNNTRLISAVLAAVLCGLILAACANNPTPPVTDVSDITTDIPTTETPTTVAPVTVATTEVLATTDTPTTVEPITTVTTDVPATDAPVFTDDLGSLLYLGEDGYVHIKGSDNIRLPAKRLDFIIKNSEEELTMSLYSQFVTTAEAAIIPLYFGISHTKNNAWVEGGKLYVKFGATDKTAEAPNEYYDYELGKKVSFTAIDYAYVSGAEAHLISNDAKTSRGYIISTFDGGESFNISAFDQAICCVYYTNSLEGTAVTYGGANMGSKTAHFLRTG